MYYEINVVKDGIHFFATDSRSITDVIKLKLVYEILKQKFPETEGYELQVTRWGKIGTSVDMSAI